jgi:hypothetical protein
MNPQTVAFIAGAMPIGIFLTVREVQRLLPVDYTVGTVRAALIALATSGRADVIALDVPHRLIKRYCLREAER